MPRSPHRACRRQLPPPHPHTHTPTPPHPHTHTHTCSEQALRILMWNVSYVQKNTPIKPDRNWLMTRGEKQCQGILSTSLLDATHPSEPRRSLSLLKDCDNCAENKVPSTCRFLAWPVPSAKKVIRMILQAMSTTSMPRSAGTGE